MKELFAIQQQLKVAKDKQGDKGRFVYRTAEGILNAVKPILEQTHCVVILTDTIWEATNGRFFLKATASLWNETDKVAEAEGFAQLDDHSFEKNGVIIQGMSREQATGSASSYARKYALCGLFAIDDASQDPDSIVKPLSTRIATATTAKDINALKDEVKELNDPEINKAFNAQISNLGLVFDTEKKLFVKQ